MRGQNVAAAERRLTTLELRKAGLSLRQIAQRTGVSVSMAKKDLDRALADLLAEQNTKAEDWRALELERLEKMHVALWPKVVNEAPNMAAVDRVLRIAERRPP